MPIIIPTADPRTSGSAFMPQLRAAFEAISQYGATLYGAIGNGTTDDRAALNTLANTTMQIIGAGGRIYFPAGTYLVNSNITFPANVELSFDPRAMLKPATGITITILGPIDARPYPIFTNALASQGTISLASNHVLTTIYSEWWGAIADNTTDSFAAIQAAQTALKTLTGGTLRFCTGIYLTSAAIQLLNVQGQTWLGNGRINTILKATGAVSAVQGNGVWYSKFIGLQFTTSSALTNLAPFALDGNYDGTNTQGVQANTFFDCLFIANGSTYAFTGGIRGGAWQGSENTFLNCHWQGGTEASYYHTGQNALANSFIGGDIQAFPKNGIKIAGGSVTILGTSFESTYGYTQIVNDGYDINASIGGAYDTITVTGVRTESLRFFKGLGAQVGTLTGINYNPSSVTNWAATAGYAVNAHLFKIAANGSVKFYRVTTAGTSAATEPIWPNTGTVTDGTVVWTQTDLIVIDLPTGSLRDSTGYVGFQLATTGIPGNFLSIARVNQVRTITTNYTASNNDDVIKGNTTSGNITITLPSGGDTPPPPDGKVVYVKKTTTDINTLSVIAGSNGIDNSGAARVILGGSEGFLILIYDAAGSQWRIVARSVNPTTATALTISSNTIAPTSDVNSVGAGLIKTITPLAGWTDGKSVTLLAGGTPWTTDVTGNITRAIAPGVNQAVTFYLYGSQWYPSI